MATIMLWCFGSFCLDAASGCLWRDDKLLPLRPKPFALLAYLVAHAGQVVTKETLLEEVWSDVVVSEGVLKDYINQIRKVLGDTARTSQYIATVHRRRYRFIAPVATVDGVPPASAAGQLLQPPGQLVQHTSGPDDLGRIIVGREAELAQLQRCRTQELMPSWHRLKAQRTSGLGRDSVSNSNWNSWFLLTRICWQLPWKRLSACLSWRRRPCVGGTSASLGAGPPRAGY